MGDLDIEIKVAVQNALAELNRAEQAANKAEKAFDGFAATFARIAAHEQRMAQEMAKARSVVDNLSGSFGKLAQALRAEQLNATARAFGGLTQQLEREAVMLERIHGPAKQMAQDLQTLEMLHRRGAISAAEYTAELQKMGAVQGPNAAQAGPSKPGLSSAAVGVGLGAAAGLGGLVAHGLKEDITRLNEHRQETLDAANALLKFYDSAEQANAALAEQRDLADVLKTKLSVAVGAYGAVREATADLYLTSQQQVAITRTLSEVMEIDGKSIESVAEVMGRLQFAMNQGTLDSRDFRAMAKAFPDLLDVWREATGKTVRELEDMAKAGQINRDVIAKFISELENGESTHAKYQQRQLSVHQIQERMNVSFLEAVRIWGDMKNGIDAMGSSVVSTEEALMRFELHWRKIFDAVSNANKAIYASQALAATVPGVLAVQQYNKDLAIQREEYEKITGPQRDYHERVDNLNMMLKTGKISQEQFNNRMNELNGTHRSAATAVREHAEALKELRNVMLSMDDASKVARGMGIRSALTGKFEDFDGARGLGASAGEQSLVSGSSSFFDSLFKGAQESGAAAAGVFESIGKAMTTVAEAAKKLTAEQEMMAEAFKTIGTSLGDQLVDAANGAGQSWAEWGESTLDWIQKAITRALILKAITGDYSGARGEAGYGGILGALGFAHGGTYIGGVGAVYGGAWANGGTWYAPQTGGGQDTIPVLSMVSPGERIDYTPPGQQPHGQAQSAAPAVVQVVNQPVDDRALLQAFSTASGRQVFHNLVRQNRSTIKALLD